VVRFALPFALALAACSGSPRAVTPPTTGADSDAATPTAPVAAEVIAHAGEQMIYRISLHGLDVAEFTVQVGATAQQAGKATIPVQTHAVSSPLLTLFHKVDDTLESWIDPATGRPVAFRAKEMASAKSDAVEETDVLFAPGKFQVKVLRDGKPIDEEQVVLHDAYDVPSMLVFVRGWDVAAGTRTTVDVMRSRTAWRVDFAVGPSESLSTTLGDLQAVRYDGEGVRILRDGSPDPASDRRRFSMWISDDADRVPVRLVAHTDYGDIRMDLVDYRAQ
jgi:hypothetical protein